MQLDSARQRLSCKQLVPLTSITRTLPIPPPRSHISPSALFLPVASLCLRSFKCNLPPPTASVTAVVTTAAAEATSGPFPSLPASVSFHDGWPLWCLLAACGAVAQICEARTRWGAALSAPLISMLCAAVMAAGGLIPIDCPAYDSVWRYLMPLAAACFLLETDVRNLASNGGPVLVAFAVGALGMVAGALAGWWLLREALGPVGAKLVACLCASYVGGSVNFAAVALAIQVPAASLPGAMAADNLMMAAFLAILMAVPVQKAAVAVAGTGSAAVAVPAGASGKGDGERVVAMQMTAGGGGAAAVSAESLSLTLAVAAAACMTAHGLAEVLNVVPLTLLILAAVAAAVAAAAQWLRGAVAAAGSRRSGKAVTAAVSDGPVFAGASQVGTSLMMLFFAVIGASAGSPSCLAGCGVLVPFLGVMVGVHWAVVVAVGRGVLRLPTEALLLGSNANIGGSATAAAMAAAKGWQPLVQPAMMAGSLGYAAGTAAGLLVAKIVGSP
ncbi:hypothetical protein Vafri_6094 [Volvox africanus]|uniref:DUF819 protein n=1 Tax=Volvox africanus TaxID=51714 RepID=A0A8J4AXX1_9CHLO|nr:hypothetical protein Vafri_6094 [Volvox africanus]